MTGSRCIVVLHDWTSLPTSGSRPSRGFSANSLQNTSIHTRMQPTACCTVCHIECIAHYHGRLMLCRSPLLLVRGAATPRTMLPPTEAYGHHLYSSSRARNFSLISSPTASSFCLEGARCISRTIDNPTSMHCIPSNAQRSHLKLIRT